MWHNVAIFVVFPYSVKFYLYATMITNRFVWQSNQKKHWLIFFMTKTKIWKAYPIFKHAQQGLSQKIYKSSHPRRNGDNNNNNHNNRAWPCWGARFEQKKTTTIRNHWPIGLSMKCRSDETLRFWGASVCERTVFAMPIKWLKWNQWLERINAPRINESVREWLSEWTYEWKNQWKGKIQKRINEGGNQCISESTNEWTNERTNCEQTKNKNELFFIKLPIP